MIATAYMNPGTSGVSHSSGLSPQGAGSEADGFDFLNYILGLQADPRWNELSDTLVSADSEKSAISEGSEQQDNLLELFNKKGSGNLANALALQVGIQPQVELATTKSSVSLLEGMQIGTSAQDPNMTLGDAGTAKAMPANLGESQVLSSDWIDSQNSLQGLRHEYQAEANDAMEASNVPQPISKRTQAMSIYSSQQKLEANQLAEDGQRLTAFDPQKSMAQDASVSTAASHAMSPKQTQPIESESGKSKLHSSHRDASELSFLGLSQNANLTGSSKNEGTSKVADAPPAQNAPMTMKEVVTSIGTLAQQGGGKMTVSLNPPNLGKIHVEVTAKGNRVEIEMTSDNDGARSLIEGGFQDLKTAIQSQDLVVSRMEVNVSRDMDRLFGDSHQMMQSHNSFSQEQSHGSFGQSSEGRSNAFSSDPNLMNRSDLSKVAPNVAAQRYALANSGRVDIRI